ncbi:MAG: heparinase II/III-family protein, partial [Armatimonadetes bacterium]|nr:heparinase II/III-family protein [Armatimonadota bacterium]
TLCWTLLWEDAGLDAVPPDDLPVWHVFKQTGFASARTSWEEDALTLHLRSGRAAVSHSHIDVNNFLLNAGGEWLLRDYGYGEVGPGYFNRAIAYFSNATAAHNCLVIGEQDQRTDDDSVGTITDAEERDGVVWFRSDATKTYEGAESVVRELALVSPHGETGKWGYVVVRDLAKTAAPETFDFMLNPGGEVAVEGDGFTIQGEHSRLVGKVLAPAGVTIEVLPGIGEHINVEDPRCVRIRAPEKASDVEFVVVLVPLAEGEDAPEIGALGAGAAGAQVGADRILFSTDGREPPRREAGQG